MQKPERSLKIYSHHRSADNKEVPELRLIGCWMEQLGFKVGDRVNITYSQGRHPNYPISKSFLMEIHDLKQHFTILDIAERLGIRVNKQGKAHCPFHNDKTPSLQFSKEKNIATCFSSRCSAGTMDIIGLTEKYMKINTHEAIMLLKEWAGYQPTNGQPKPKESDILERIAILTKAFQYYENGIRTSRKSKAYLDGRGPLIQTTPNRQGVEVGFNSGNFHNRALKYGLVYESIGNSGGYTAFAKDSLVFPLKNQDRKIVGLYFRLLDEKATNRHFYLKDRQGLYPQYPRPETCLFQLKFGTVFK